VPDPTAAADLGPEALVAGDNTADHRHGEIIISTQSTRKRSEAESVIMKAAAAAGSSLDTNFHHQQTDSSERSHSRRPSH
jgi:hypothetical protein